MFFEVDNKVVKHWKRFLLYSLWSVILLACGIFPTWYLILSLTNNYCLTLVIHKAHSEFRDIFKLSHFSKNLKQYHCVCFLFTAMYTIYLLEGKNKKKYRQKGWYKFLLWGSILCIFRKFVNIYIYRVLQYRSYFKNEFFVLNNVDARLSVYKTLFNFVTNSCDKIV